MAHLGRGCRRHGRVARAIPCGEQELPTSMLLTMPFVGTEIRGITMLRSIGHASINRLP